MLNLKEARQATVHEVRISGWSKEISFELGGLSIHGILQYHGGDYWFYPEDVLDRETGAPADNAEEVSDYLEDLPDAALYHLDLLTRQGGAVRA